jgi:hypothetical protein
VGRRDALRPFFQVRRWLEAGADDLTLTTLDRSILAQLAGFMDSDGSNGRPGVELLAVIAGVHPGSVKRSLKRLRDFRLIEPMVKKPRAGLAQEWRFTEEFADRLRALRRGTGESPSRGTGESPSRGTEESPSGSGRGTGESKEGNRGARRGVPGSTPTDLTDRTDGDGDNSDAADASEEPDEIVARLWPMNGRSGRKWAEWAEQTAPLRQALRASPRRPGESDDEVRTRIEAEVGS